MYVAYSCVETKIFTTWGSDTWRLPSVRGISRRGFESAKRDSHLDWDRSRLQKRIDRNASHRPKTSADEGRGIHALIPGRSQSRKNATHGIGYRLKVSGDKSSQRRGPMPRPGITLAATRHRTAPIRRRSRQSRKQPSGDRAEEWRIHVLFQTSFRWAIVQHETHVIGRRH